MQYIDQVYKSADEILDAIVSGKTLARSNKSYSQTEEVAIQLLLEEGYIKTGTNEPNSILEITPAGGGVQIFGVREFLQKEKTQKALEASLTFKKLQNDVEKSSRDLKDYSFTKWFSRIAVFISFGLLVIKILEWIMAANTHK